MSRTAEADKAALAEMVSSRIKQLETEVADSGNGGSVPAFDELPTPANFAEELKEPREPAKVHVIARQRYSTLHQQCALMHRKLREANSVVLRLSKEKDRLTADLQKERSAKAKLSDLCRELQRQLKTSKEEAARTMAMEKERHKDLMDKFASSIEDINGKFEAHTKERATLVEENEDLRKKLKGLLEQIDVREEHFKKQLKAKELEHKLEEAKHAQTSSRLEQAQQETQATRKEAEAARASEATTREKLDAYVEKFESFQGTLSKSNETFKLYQSELKKMTKAIKTLEKEKQELRESKSKGDVALIEATEALQRVQAENTRVSGQRDKLQGLCRSLQDMRKAQDERVQRLEAALAEQGVSAAEAAAPAATRSPGDAAAGETAPSEEGGAAATATE